MRFFQVKVKYFKNIEDGLAKKVSETYILDAETFGDAEARIAEKLAPYVCDEFQVTAIRITPISTFVRQEGDGLFYEVMVNHVTVDPVSGKEIKMPETILIQDSDVDSATKTVRLKCVSGIHDIEISYVKETKIEEVFWTVEQELNE